MNILRRRLMELPAPGHGAGCYHKMFGPICGAVNRGVPDDQIADMVFEIVNNLPGATRRIPMADIKNSIASAHSRSGSYRPSKPIRYDKAEYRAYRQKIINQGREYREFEDIYEMEEAIRMSSPISFGRDFVDFMWNMWDLDEFVFIGDKFGSKVHKVADCIAAAEMGRTLPEQISINPFTGRTAEKSNGGESYRCDNAVSDFKYYVAEFDCETLQDQLYFWIGFNQDIRAIVYSGSKSYHIWFEAPPCETIDDWRVSVENEIFRKKLSPLGVDGSTYNPARLMRTPGAIRESTGSPQYLLWLSDRPRKIFEME